MNPTYPPKEQIDREAYGVQKWNWVGTEYVKRSQGSLGPTSYWGGRGQFKNFCWWRKMRNIPYDLAIRTIL